jgi:hypothetical protein
VAPTLETPEPTAPDINMTDPDANPGKTNGVGGPPVTRTVKVKEGGTLSGSVGISDPDKLDRIAQYNGLRSRHEVRAGQSIVIPSDEVLAGIDVSDSVSRRGSAGAAYYAKRQADAAQAAESANEMTRLINRSRTQLSENDNGSGSDYGLMRRGVASAPSDDYFSTPSAPYDEYFILTNPAAAPIAEVVGKVGVAATFMGKGALTALGLGIAELPLEVADVITAGRNVLTDSNYPMYSMLGRAAERGASTEELLIEVAKNVVSINPLVGATRASYNGTEAALSGDLEGVGANLVGVAASFGAAKSFGFDRIGIESASIPPGMPGAPRGALGFRLTSLDEAAQTGGRVREGNTILRIGEQGQTLSFFAKVTAEDLGTGTPTNASSRAWARALGYETDDAGHFAGRQLGGYGGSTSGNIFPQTPNINRGAYAQFESEIAGAIREEGYGFIRVKPEYTAASPTRPVGITYQVRIGGKTYVDYFGN